MTKEPGPNVITVCAPLKSPKSRVVCFWPRGDKPSLPLEKNIQFLRDVSLQFLSNKILSQKDLDMHWERIYQSMYILIDLLSGSPISGLPINTLVRTVKPMIRWRILITPKYAMSWLPFSRKYQSNQQFWKFFPSLHRHSFHLTCDAPLTKTPTLTFACSYSWRLRVIYSEFFTK